MKIPKELREKILARDVECQRCGFRPAPTSWPLELHHLIGRGSGGSLPKDLQADPMNLICLCGGPVGCHAKVTGHYCQDWRAWTISRFGDLRKNLGKFWERLGKDWRIEA